MLTQRLYLKDYFPELGENGCNAYVDSYIPSAFKNVERALATKKYPCVLVCPGGAYSSTTDRETWVIHRRWGYACSRTRTKCCKSASMDM